MEEKNIYKPAKTIEENNLNDDIEFIYTALDKKRRIYKLSYDDNKLEDLSEDKIKEYVEKNYLEKDISNQPDKYFDKHLDKLLKDIATFKTFRDNLKEDMDNKNNLYSSISNLAIASSTSFLTVIVSYDLKSNIILFQILSVIFTIATVYLLIKLISFECKRKGNSKFNKLKIVNESIHILEYKKEKLDKISLSNGKME